MTWQHMAVKHCAALIRLGETSRAMDAAQLRNGAPCWRRADDDVTKGQFDAKLLKIGQIKVKTLSLFGCTL